MRLFTFDHLITPSIIKFLFYLGVFFSFLGAFGAFGYAQMIGQYVPGLGSLAFLAAIVELIIGIVVSRVIAELVLVLFMIRDELAWQRTQREVPTVPNAVGVMPVAAAE